VGSCWRPCRAPGGAGPRAAHSELTLVVATRLPAWAIPALTGIVKGPPHWENAPVCAVTASGPYSEALGLARRAPRPPRPLAGRGPACQWPSARLRAGQRSGTQTKRICRGAIRAGRHCHATCNGDLDVRTGGVEAIDYCPPNIMLAPVFGPQVDKSYGAGYSSSLLPSTSANAASHSKSCAEASCQL
jgi:hypothetical protein